MRLVELVCLAFGVAVASGSLGGGGGGGDEATAVLLEKWKAAAGGIDRSVVTDLLLDWILDVYAPVSDVFDNEACRNQSLFYKQEIKKGKAWAVKMFDSGSKFPDGLLEGNLAQMGNYDECLAVQDVPSPSGRFSGQHCMVSVGGSTGKSVAELAQRPQATPDIFERSRVATRAESDEGSTSALSLKWSVCIPSSCRAGDLELHLQHVFRALLNVTSIRVNPLLCNSRAHVSQFKANDWFAVGFVCFFVVLVTASTCYDLVVTNSESRVALLTAFSFYTNGKKLLAAPVRGGDTLPALHGVRFLSMMWVVLGHRYLFFVLSPAINTVVALDYLSDWKHLVITNATISVDSFLLLSGILVSYIFMKEMDKGVRFNVPLYYLHRYIRLTPALGAMMLFSATLLNYVDEGPFWNQSMASYSRDNCETNWWLNLLYVNNYFHVDHMCLGQTWYLAVDMQLFWLSPLLLYPLWRWPKYGKILLGALLALGLLIAFLVAFFYQFSVANMAGGDAGRMQYFPMHTRFTPWLIGVALGYLLHKTKHSTITMSRLQVAVGWSLSVGLMLTSFLLAHRFLQPGHVYERWFESIYTCLMRPAWALGLAWVLFASIKGYGGIVNTFLSWGVFQVLGRFTYAVYLVHMSVMIWIAGSVRYPQYISDSVIVRQYFGDVIISFGVAFVLSVVFESPAIVIEKALLGKPDRVRERREKADDSEGILREETPQQATQSSPVIIRTLVVGN